MSVAERVQAVRTRIARAADDCGRDPATVTLVAVCKHQPLDRVRAVVACGIGDLGENTAQGLERTATALGADASRVRWHFVGRLQTNKVKAVLRHALAVHSVDRLSLAELLAMHAAAPVDVWVQVNLGSEPQKGGVLPDETVALATAVAKLPALRLRGLMAIPPANDDPTPHFARLRALSEALRRAPGCAAATELSMGMSRDFEQAITQGATLVRVGTALFGERT